MHIPYSYLLPFMLLLYVSLIEAAAQQKKQDIYYPEPGQWEHIAPEAAGMNGGLVSEAVSYAKEHESKAPKNLEEAHYLSFGQEPFGYAIGPFKERGAATGLIIKNGYIVAEWGNPQRVDQTFSVAKSFLSTTVGLAYDRDMIKDINDKVHTYMAPIIPYTPQNLPLINRRDCINQMYWNLLRLNITGRSPGTTCSGKPVTGKVPYGENQIGLIGPKEKPIPG